MQQNAQQLEVVLEGYVNKPGNNLSFRTFVLGSDGALYIPTTQNLIGVINPYHPKALFNLCTADRGEISNLLGISKIEYNPTNASLAYIGKQLYTELTTVVPLIRAA